MGPTLVHIKLPFSYSSRVRGILNFRISKGCLYKCREIYTFFEVLLRRTLAPKRILVDFMESKRIIVIVTTLRFGLSTCRSTVALLRFRISATPQICQARFDLFAKKKSGRCNRRFFSDFPRRILCRRDRAILFL